MNINDKEDFINNLIERITDLVEELESASILDEDFSLIHEMTNNVLEELETLQDD